MRKSLTFQEILELQKHVALRRDEASYKELFLHFHKPLLELAHSFTGTRETAEEIVCDVMMKIWTMREALMGINDLKLYLYQAVRNSSINELKKNRKHAVIDIGENEPFDTSLHNPEELLIKDELAYRLALGINALPPQCRLVYRLVREERFTYRQVAQILDISVNTVDRHLNNALHKLMDALRQYLTC